MSQPVSRVRSWNTAAVELPVGRLRSLQGGHMSRPFSTLPPSTLPRERLVSEGREALSDVELLALQLRSGTRGTSANDLAAGLLAEFGDLRRLSSALPEELARLPGIGIAKAASIVASFELGRRLAHDKSERPLLARASDVAVLAQTSLAGLRRERVIVFVCDRRSRLVSEVRLTEGSANRSLLDVREVMNAVLRHDGESFALAHNHPSRDVQPSQNDVEATQSVAYAAKTIGLRFLGHVIVTDDEWSTVDLKPVRQMLD